MVHASEKTILVVDDEPDVRNYLAACIEDAGFKVITAVDGIDAMEKIEEQPPDLMTLDMVMPRQSGINLMRKLRKIEKYAQIPVIVITAHARDEFGSEDIKKLTAFTAHHRPKYTLEKPITPEKLVKAICDILDVDAYLEEPQVADSSEYNDLIKLINTSDPDTLEKIKALLDK